MITNCDLKYLRRKMKLIFSNVSQYNNALLYPCFPYCDHSWAIFYHPFSDFWRFIANKNVFPSTVQLRWLTKRSNFIQNIMYGTMDNLVAYKMLIQQTKTTPHARTVQFWKESLLYIFSQLLMARQLGVTREELFCTIQGRKNIA